jgi:hypothetical protein
VIRRGLEPLDAGSENTLSFIRPFFILISTIFAMNNKTRKSRYEKKLKKKNKEEQDGLKMMLTKQNLYFLFSQP